METLNKTLLITLLDFAQMDVPASVSRLALELNRSRAQIATGLNQLAQEGLVAPETVRLTFVGLMHATGLRARHYRSQGKDVAA
jgi:predicted transcriptional regulator